MLERQHNHAKKKGSTPSTVGYEGTLIALLLMSCSKVGMNLPNIQCTMPVNVLPRTAIVAAMPLLLGKALHMFATGYVSYKPEQLLLNNSF